MTVFAESTRAEVDFSLRMMLLTNILASGKVMSESSLTTTKSYCDCQGSKLIFYLGFVILVKPSEKGLQGDFINPYIGHHPNMGWLN